MGYKDFELSETKIKEFERYSAKWTEQQKANYLDGLRADYWVEENCVRDKENSWSEKRWNCYHVGSIRWVMKDGSPLSDDAIEAIKIMDHGQKNQFTVSEDGMYIDHYWECDSGD